MRRVGIVVCGCFASLVAAHAGAALSGSPSSVAPSPTPSVDPSPGPSAVPPLYADLYSQLSGDLGDFRSAVTDLGGGVSYPVAYAGQLTAANSNNGPNLLNAGSMTLIQEELQALKDLGVQAVSVEVSFPMLYAPFLGSTYDQWATFYGNIAAAVRAQGLRLIVESQSLIPTGLDSTAWGPQLQAFYPTLTFSQYVAARASTAAAVASIMHPDYFVLQEEPDTESNQSGQAEVGTVSGSTTMLNASQAAVAGLVPGMKVGAGFGTWLAAFQSFANAFTRTDCGAGQPCVSLPLDFLDLHVYPIIEHAINCTPQMACPSGVTNFWQNALAVVATANAAHLHMTISQAWLRKVRDSEWNRLSNGGDIEEAREAYNFWAPLDQSFLKVLYDLAGSQGMYFLAPFNTQNFFAYLTWSAATSIVGDCGSGASPCGTLTPAQVFSAVQSAAQTAMTQGAYSTTGQYWHDLIAPSPTPAATPSALPTTPVSACAGDCDGNGRVTVDEVVRAVDIDLGVAALATCRAADVSGDGKVTINEVIQAVKAALDGCPGSTPMATTPATAPAASPTVTATSATPMPSAAASATPTAVPSPPTATHTFTGTPTGAAANTPTPTFTPTRIATEIVYDCQPATGCSQLTVSGDPVDTNSPSGFYGNLDPCLRRDPNGNHALYFLYSFPMVIPGAHTPTIEIHLASSTDHGATWNFLANVWPYAKQGDGNYSSHEVSSLAAQTLNGATTWYAISHYYEVPPGGSAANPNSALYVEPVFTQSTYFVLVSASDPAQLATPADSTILISGGTSSAYVSLSYPNLTVISGESSAVTWREPALLVQGDVLYLAAQEANAGGAFGDIALFAARTTGKMSTWTWKYLGKLFAPGDPAQVLPAATHPVFTEIDLTQRPDGQIVAIMTAMDLANQQKYGSRTADVASLGTYEPVSPPAMVRDGQGRLIPTGQFTASDLNVAPNEGPGASTYEAAEPDVGLLIARRGITPNVHGFTFDTGQHPE